MSQAWRDEQKTKWATPDHTEVLRNGKVFTRSLAKRCPMCKDVFWTYQQLGHEQPPYQEDLMPEHGKGQRETCGNPKCGDTEQQIQFEIHMRYLAQRQAEQQQDTPQEDPIKAKKKI